MKTTKKIFVGGIAVGGGSPITIQSMTNTDTRDINATVMQIAELENAGCEIVRVAVLDEVAARAIAEIKKQINIPIVADIHFDYKLALLSIENGCDKMRINPGNIGGFEKLKAVAYAANEKNIPIRVGVNSGSLEKDILEKYGGVTENGLVESALSHAEMLERCDFYNLVIAVKTSSVAQTIKAYRMLAEKTDYPLHIGVTEAGNMYSGVIKSSIGIGALLADGIGDTLRVSLTGNPVSEVKCAKEILSSLEIRKFGVEIISCPTCGRTEIDLVKLSEEIEKRCEHIRKNIKVAVMGCVVNGPGEARSADIGVSGGRGVGIIFKKGEIIKKVHENEIISELMKEIELL